jgi:hypothetical protein
VNPIEARDLQSVTYALLPDDVKQEFTSRGNKVKDFPNSVVYLLDSFVESFGALREGIADFGGNTNADPFLTEASRPQWNSPLLGYIPVRAPSFFDYANEVEYLGNGYYGSYNSGNPLMDLRGVVRHIGSHANAGCFYRAVPPSRIYVDKNHTGGSGKGDSWVNAITDLRLALDVVDHNILKTNEIWVEGGTYTAPNTNSDPQDIVCRTQGYRNLRLFGGFGGGELLASAEGLRLEVIPVARLEEMSRFGQNLVVLADVLNTGESQLRVFDSIGTLIVDRNLGAEPVLGFDKSELRRSKPGYAPSINLLSQIQTLLGLSHPAYVLAFRKPALFS